MAKLEFKGMKEYLKTLNDVAWATEDVCKAAVYSGADVMADEIRAGINSLKTTTDKGALAAYKNRQATYISESQKAGLIESFGVASIQNDYGVVHTKLGFDGYNSVKTLRYPDGQPNALIARVCNSGRVSMIAQPFIDQAVKRARKRTLTAMGDAADKKIKEITGGK